MAWSELWRRRLKLTSALVVSSMRKSVSGVPSTSHSGRRTLAFLFPGPTPFAIWELMCVCVCVCVKGRVKAMAPKTLRIRRVRVQQRCNLIRHLPACQRGILASDAIASLWVEGGSRFTKTDCSMPTSATAAALRCRLWPSHSARSTCRTLVWTILRC